MIKYKHQQQQQMKLIPKGSNMCCPYYVSSEKKIHLRNRGKSTFSSNKRINKHTSETDHCLFFSRTINEFDGDFILYMLQKNQKQKQVIR
jgi:hypothetical protein